MADLTRGKSTEPMRLLFERPEDLAAGLGLVFPSVATLPTRDIERCPLVPEVCSGRSESQLRTVLLLALSTSAPQLTQHSFELWRWRQLGSR